MLYLVMSFVLPLAISAIPFTTHSYGYQNGGWCWIQDHDQDSNCTTHDNVAGQIEEYVMWFVPAVIGLFASSLLVIAMVTILCCRIHCNRVPQFARRRAVQKSTQTDGPAGRVPHRVLYSSAGINVALDLRRNWKQHA